MSDVFLACHHTEPEKNGCLIAQALCCEEAGLVRFALLLTVVA